MQIAPSALNVLETFRANEQNSELAEMLREAEQRNQEKNSNLRQFRSNQALRDNQLNSRTENNRQVRFPYD